MFSSRRSIGVAIPRSRSGAAGHARQRRSDPPYPREGRRAPRVRGALPNALVDAQGQPPSGPLTIDIAGYDTTHFDDLPGDRSARNSAGADLALISFGGLSVDITDATGRHYDLAPGKQATLTFPAPPAAGRVAPPATLQLGRYEEATGVWTLTGEARLDGTCIAAQSDTCRSGRRRSAH